MRDGIAPGMESKIRLHRLRVSTSAWSSHIQAIYNLGLMKKRVSKPTPSPSAATAPITLSVDIGGTGIKMMALDASGKPVSDRFRALTPDNPTPERVLAVLDQLREQIPAFDRVSVGFPRRGQERNHAGGA